LSRIPRETIALAKLCVWDGLDLPLAQGLRMEQRLAHRLATMSASKSAPAK